MFLPPDYACYLSTNFTIIDQVGEDFNDAIRHLKRQDCIGISVEPTEIERHSNLRYLSASIPANTYLFDISKLGGDGFSQGLKTVLEDSLIQKIVHDCRQISNCLSHRYNTTLTNVYDTQVADVLVTALKAQDGKISRRLKPLSTCLKLHLNISDEYLPHQMHPGDNYCLSTDHQLRNFLLKNVLYLRLLKKELDLMLKVPFRRCVDVYLQSILRRSDQDLKLNAPDTESVPAELLFENVEYLKLSKDVVRRRNNNSALHSFKRDNYAKRQQKCDDDTNGFQGSLGELLSADAYSMDKREMILYLLSKMFECEAAEVKSIPSNISDHVTASSEQETITSLGTVYRECSDSEALPQETAKEQRSQSSVKSSNSKSPSQKLKQMLEENALKKMLLNNCTPMKDTKISDHPISGNEAQPNDSRCGEDRVSEATENHLSRKSSIVSPQSRLKDVLNSYTSKGNKSTSIKTGTDSQLNTSNSSSCGNSSTKYGKLLECLKNSTAAIDFAPKAFDSSNGLKSDQTSSHKSDLKLPDSASTENINNHSSSKLPLISSANNSPVDDNLKSKCCSGERVSTSEKNDATGEPLLPDGKFSFKNVDAVFCSLVAESSRKEDSAKPQSVKNEETPVSVLMLHSKDEWLVDKHEFTKCNFLNTVSEDGSVDLESCSSKDDGMRRQSAEGRCSFKETDSRFCSLLKQESPLTDSEGWSSEEEDAPPVKRAESGEDPWSKFRDDFSARGPTKDSIKKTAFVPAGMQF